MKTSKKSRIFVISLIEFYSPIRNWIDNCVVWVNVCMGGWSGLGGEHVGGGAWENGLAKNSKTCWLFSGRPFWFSNHSHNTKKKRFFTKIQHFRQFSWKNCGQKCRFWALFGKLLHIKIYYKLAAPEWTCSFEFCREMQNVKSSFTEFNQFLCIFLYKNNSSFWKQKWIIIDYNGYHLIFIFRKQSIKVE